METKNAILANYAHSVSDASNTISIVVSTLGDNADENAAIIKTLNVLVESLRSQTVLIQQAIDNYN